MDIKDLSLEEKIGQRFIFGVNSSNIDVVLDMVKECKIGGIILYRRNYKTYNDMIKVIKKFKTANKNNRIPLFIAIDEEGGVVNRIPDEIIELKNIYDVTKKDYKLTLEYASIISEILRETGINMNFAPVVDIYNNSKSKALEKRCFYGDKEDVYKGAKVYIDVASKNRIVSVPKHYPGHGSTKRDSHLLMPYVMDYNEVLDKHMYPFNELIKDSIDALMVGHIRIKKICRYLPATLNNSFLEKYLRKDNNYDGLIISDEVNMLRRNPTLKFNYEDKMLKSLADIILIKLKNNNEGYKLLNKYKKILEKDNDKLLLLDLMVERILRVKKKYKINDDVSFTGVDVEAINKRIDKINKEVIG